MLLRHPLSKDANAGRVTVFARLRTAEAAQAVVTALPSQDVELDVAVTTIAALDGRLPAGIHAAILDVDFAAPAELDAAERLIAAHREHCAFVLTSANPTVDGMRRLIRQGISDLLPQPIQTRDLVDAVLGNRHGGGGGRQGAPGNVVSFLKCGGGAGTTSLAVQAACAQGVRRGNQQAETCVLDLDIQFGSIGLHLDLNHPSSLIDAVAAGQRLDGTMLRGMLAHHRTGIDVLPAPRLLQPFDAVTPEDIARIIDVARHEYARILLDLPQAWTAWTRAALAESDRIALVLQLSVPSIRLAQRQLETIADEGLAGIPLTVVANRVAKGLFASHTTIGVKEAEAALERPIDHILPSDAGAMFTAVNLGVPLTEVKGGDKLARRMAEVLDAILAGAPQAART